MWGGKLQEATASLAKLANKGITPEPKTAMDVDALDVVELAEAKVDEAIATEQERHDRRQQQQQSAFQLVAALKQAQEKAGKDLAEQTSQREREGSRTPQTRWTGRASHCRNIVFFAGQLCGNAAGAYQAVTCSSPWQGLRIDGHQSDRSLGAFFGSGNFPHRHEMFVQFCVDGPFFCAPGAGADAGSFPAARGSV